jgi:L-fucose isomerase
MHGKLAVIPFGYPFYPGEIVEKQIQQSKALLRNLSPLFLDTVYSRDEAKKTVRSLREKNPDLVVAMLVSWIEAPHLVDSLKEYFGKPLLLWSHTTFQSDGKKKTLGAFVAAGVIKQTLEDFDVPFQFIYGKPGDKRVLLEVESYYHAAVAFNKLKNARIGLIGYPALGMYTGTLDHITLRKLFGPEIVHLDQYQLIKRAEKIEEGETASINEMIKSTVKLGENVRSEDIVLSSKLYRALQAIVEENELDAVTVKCQYEMSQMYNYTPCVALSLLGNELPASCEGDLLTILSELILHYLTYGIVTYVDIHEVLEDRVLVACCGFSPFSLSDKKDCVICRWGWEAFSGVLNASPLSRGKVTMARLSRDRGGFKLHAAKGNSVEKSEWVEVGCPQFPGTDIVLDGNPGEFAKALVSNHYALVYADVTKELEHLCCMLNVRYIYT